MKLNWKKGWVVGAAAAVMLMSACGAQGNNGGTTGMHSLSDEAGVPGHLHDAGIIPSYDSTKTQTTNERGKTTSGMGTSVYSLMGSSSLHGGGISSHIQSRLDSAGIEGVRAFVLDDTVILAQRENMISSNNYDNLQWKLLSGTKGWSGKGEDVDGLSGTDVVQSNDSMKAAKEQVSKMFSADVTVLTVTNPEAVDLINTITSKLRSNAKDTEISNHISKLLKMASER